jgi:serine/threonine-protein kinase SRPK3
VLKKLGFGAFSTVWLSLNIKDRKLYALKVMKSAEKYTKASFNEEEINRLVAENHNSPVWVESVKRYLGRTATRDDNHCL